MHMVPPIEKVVSFYYANPAQPATLLLYVEYSQNNYSSRAFVNSVPYREGSSMGGLLHTAP